MECEHRATSTTFRAGFRHTIGALEITYLGQPGSDMWKVQRVVPKNTSGTGRMEHRIERRQWIRYFAQSEILCQRASEETTSQWSATIQNISEGGICLLIEAPFGPGDLLHVEVPRSSENTALKLLTCVVHSSRAQVDSWSLGCSFIRELSDIEMEAFLSR